LLIEAEPLSTGASSIYPYSQALANRLVAVSRFDDEYPLYRIFGKRGNERIAVPRNLAPISSNDCRDVGGDVDFNSLFKHRNDEQYRVVKASAAKLKAGRSFVTQAPTGFGKTVCAMDVIAKVGKRTLIIVTKEDLRDQWIAEAKKILGLSSKDIGLIQGDRADTLGKPLSIGLVQSVSRFDRYPAATFSGIGLTVFDEVHRMGADVFSNACFILPSKLRWGLSATPTRSDGKELMIRANIGKVEVSTKQMQMVPKIYRAYTDVKFPNMRQTPGRMAHFDRILTRDHQRNNYIARFIKMCYEKERHTIVFSSTKAHLEWLRSGLTKQEREAAKKRRVILATYAYTSEATDIPSLDAMVMATPRSNVVQITGRILREHDNKKTPVVLDLVDPVRMYRNYANKRSQFYLEIGAETRRILYG
jgi:superfamily II DNA or RNA helicase